MIQPIRRPNQGGPLKSLVKSGVATAALLVLTVAVAAAPALGEASEELADSGASREAAEAVALQQPRYAVERDGASMGTFLEVSGLGSETDVVEFREGSDTGEVIRKLPGLHRVPDVTLKRGITSNQDLWQWRQEVVDGALVRSTVIVSLLGRSGEPVAVWKLTRAWPSKVTGPAPTSDSGDVALEVLTLSHEGIERIQ